LADAELARQEAHQQHAAELATGTSQLAERQAQFDARLAQAARTQAMLEENLAEIDATLQETEQLRAAEAITAAERLAERDAEFRATLAEVIKERDALKEQVTDAAVALERVRQARVADAAAASEHLKRREAEFAAMLADAKATREALELRLAEAETALQRAKQQAAADQLAAEQLAAERQVEFEALLARETAARKVVLQNLTEAEAARKEADERHRSELAAAAAHLAEREAHYNGALAEAAAAREALERKLADEDTARLDAHQRHASELATVASYIGDLQAQYDGALAQVGSARDALELARHVYAGEAAAAAQRHAALEAEVANEASLRSGVERDLIETRLASEQARRRFLEVASTIRRRVHEHKARLEERSTRERVEHERLLTESHEEIRNLQIERDELQQSLGLSQEEFQQLTNTHNEARASHERARAASEAELRQLSGDYAQVQQTLERARIDFHTLERVSNEHATERAKLDALVTERDAQLKEQAATHLAAQQAARDAVMQIEERLRQALDASSRKISQFQRDLTALRQELDTTQDDRDALRKQADRVPNLLQQLDAAQAENFRQFENTPYGQCRCTRDGVLKHANGTLAMLLGYRSADELRHLDFGTTVFESADDLRFLIERCLATGTRESLETTWKKKDGRRLTVRLMAQAAPSDSIEIVTEDITDLYVLEERLRQAHRMEAVGRLASEVAITCDNLLRDVSQDGQQWLAAIDNDASLRQHGELLLGEVMRAASLLRQLSAYGNKQTTALEPVNVQRVLRHLEPVLKRVAGDDIELVLPKTSPSVNVDVEAERVERVLVNVASYARARMPSGGRLKIEVATTVVDRRFIAKYPNVRPGAHVLITVTEEQVAAHSNWPAGNPAESDAAEGGVKTVTDKPGVDLGVLLGLIGDCGGHLWMTAEPPGNMVLKIHLPQVASDQSPEPRPPVARPERARPKARWFRH
jgi:hypothetical protein